MRRKLTLISAPAGNQLNEIRVSDLCFTEDETTRFFNTTMDLNLSNREIAIIKSRTEGWIAGLQLAALSMQGRGDIPRFIKAFAGDSRFIVDYLVEEVLNLQSADMAGMNGCSVVSSFLPPPGGWHPVTNGLDGTMKSGS